MHRTIRDRPLVGMTETRSSLLIAVRDRADVVAWREFDALYRPLILAYAQKQGLGHADAHDVAQEVFVKLTRELGNFRLDRRTGRFRTWLYRVTANARCDWARRRYRRAAAEAEWSDPPHDSEALWMALHHQRVLEYVLGRVRPQTNPRTWACFERHLLRSRPASEVAAELGLSVNSVYTNASRVLGRVRELCREYCEELSDDPTGLPE